MFHSVGPITLTPKSYQPVKSKYSAPKLKAWFTKVTLKGSLNSGFKLYWIQSVNKDVFSKQLPPQNMLVTGDFKKS